MTRIYRHPTIKSLNDHYREIIGSRKDYSSILHYLEDLANRMLEGIMVDNESQYYELNNYHPNFIGQQVHQMRSADITLAHCQDCISRQHGYTDWKVCTENTQVPFDHQFEDAVDAIISGNLKKLSALLSSRPLLVQDRSRYGHKAGLIHYCGNNGIEFWRQQVPMNLKDIIKQLISAGVDLNMKMYVYGDWHNTHSLYTSSAHPTNAGISNEVVELLKPKNR